MDHQAKPAKEDQEERLEPTWGKTLREATAGAPGAPVHLVGYSQGARNALETLLGCPAAAAREPEPPQPATEKTVGQGRWIAVPPKSPVRVALSHTLT